MAQAILHELTLEAEECFSCHIIFYVPSWFRQQRKETGGSFYCPNGHGQHYTKTEIMRLREKLDKQMREASRQAARALDAERIAERLRKRAKAGLCPCCHRSFVALARHLKTKHPDFAP